jgi:hypothetical protein
MRSHTFILTENQHSKNWYQVYSVIHDSTG